MSTFRALLFAFSAAGIAACGSSTALNPGIPAASTNALATGSRYAYVSDTFAGKVYVYAWSVPGMKRGTYIRSIHLTEPFGGCADGKGDVYITNLNNGNGEIIEYRGDSGRRIRKLRDLGNVPFSCAVDPTTGDIAVANIGLAATSGGNGSVFVYPGGRGPAIRFSDLPSSGGALQAIYFVAYDGSGKLYVDGSVVKCLSFTLCGAPFDAHVDVLPSCCSAKRPSSRWRSRVST